MTWRQSTGRESCLMCRDVIPEGAPLHIGERTGAKFCEACAAQELGLAPDGPIPRWRPVETGVTGIAELRAKFAPTVRANWGEEP